jgi:hypothetical protein
LFQDTASSTRTMCDRSASRSDGMRAGASGTGATWACRNSISLSRITRPGADSAARDTVLSSSRMLPGQWYACSSDIDSGENVLASSVRPFPAQ